MHKVGDIITVAGMGRCRVVEVFPMHSDDPDIHGQLCTGIGVEKITDDVDHELMRLGMPEHLLK